MLKGEKCILHLRRSCCPACISCVAHSHARYHYNLGDIVTKSSWWLQTQSSWPSRLTIRMTLFFGMTGFFLVPQWPYHPVSTANRHLVLSWSLWADSCLHGPGDSWHSDICCWSGLGPHLWWPCWVYLYWNDCHCRKFVICRLHVCVYNALQFLSSPHSLSSSHFRDPLLLSKSLFPTSKSFGSFYNPLIKPGPSVCLQVWCCPLGTSRLIIGYIAEDKDSLFPRSICSQYQQSWSNSWASPWSMIDWAIVYFSKRPFSRVRDLDPFQLRPMALHIKAGSSVRNLRVFT